MTTPPFSVAFHVGVHKTATSHLQRSLNKAAVGLAMRGVRFYGPKAFREPGMTLPARFGLRQNGPAPDTALDDLRLDGHRLVLSEENYIGALNHPKGFGIKSRYADAGQRLAALAEAMGCEIDVFLCVRRPTTFLNSAYCQMLLGGRVQTVGAYQKRNPLSSVDWVQLVAGIRAAPGVGRLFVWRHEDYAAVFAQIIASLVTPEAADRVVPIPRHVNRGLSVQAVQRVLAAPDAHPDARLAADARRTYPVEDGFPSFDGFTPADHEIGDAIYARQIAAIAALEGVTLLQPAGI